MTPESRPRNTVIVPLLVGIAMAALAAVLIAPRFMARTIISQRSPAHGMLGNFRRAIELYQVDHHGRPPRKLQELISQPLFGPEADGWKGPYLQDVVSIPRDPWGHPYVYQAPGPDGAAYAITSYGADGKPDGFGDAEDVTVAAPR